MLLFGGGVLCAKKGMKFMKNQNLNVNKKKFFFPAGFKNKNLNIFARNDLKGFEKTMTRSEALKILNIGPTANREKIREVHKQLMLKNHPDNGGSTYIAAKVNEAKDLLLK